jgi:hypothetical protein
MPTFPSVARLSALCALMAMPALADEAEDVFVEANLLGIFYHELGHAMIDLLGLPVFGQEEDAADVASVMMIVALFDSESALDLAYDTSFGFAGEALLAKAEGAEVAWWGVHGPDEQRFYNTVCLFYGADPEAHDGFAEDMGLPLERAETCEDEFDLAWDSWAPIFDELADTRGAPLDFVDEAGGLTAEVIGAEVAALNEEFRWPERLAVVVADCGTANAWYDPEALEIVMCNEFAAHLRVLYRLPQ